MGKKSETDFIGVNVTKRLKLLAEEAAAQQEVTLSEFVRDAIWRAIVSSIDPLPEEE